MFTEYFYLIQFSIQIWGTNQKHKTLGAVSEPLSHFLGLNHTLANPENCQIVIRHKARDKAILPSSINDRSYIFTLRNHWTLVRRFFIKVWHRLCLYRHRACMCAHICECACVHVNFISIFPKICCSHLPSLPNSSQILTSLSTKFLFFSLATTKNKNQNEEK